MRILKNLLLGFMLCFSTFSFAQNQVKYFDSNWQETTNKYAPYYRIIEYNSRGQFTGVIEDYYRDGTLQCALEADYYRLGCGSHPTDCGMKNGTVAWYHKNGKISKLIRIKDREIISIIEQTKYGTFTTTLGCIEGDCSSGYGTFVYDNGDLYKGYFRNGKLHGTGDYTWANGQNHKGQFAYGKIKDSSSSDLSAQDIKDGLEVGLLLLQVYNEYNKY